MDVSAVMDKSDFEKISKINYDAAISAADALQKMISKDVKVNFQNINLTPLDTINKITGDTVISICGVSGDIIGDILMFYPKQKCLSLIETMSMAPAGSVTVMDESAVAAFKELINILGGAYLSSIANNFRMQVFPEPPKYIGDLEDIKRGLFQELSTVPDNILSVDTELVVESDAINGHLFMILANDSLHKIMELLNK